MKNENEKFDDIVRSKLESRQFAMPDDAWARAEQMIAARSRRPWYITGFIGVVIVGIIAFWLGLFSPGQNKPLADKKNPVSNSSSQNNTGNSVSSSADNSSSAASSSSSDQNNSSEQNNPASCAQNNNLSSANNSTAANGSSSGNTVNNSGAGKNNQSSAGNDLANNSNNQPKKNKDRKKSGSSSTASGNNTDQNGSIAGAGNNKSPKNNNPRNSGNGNASSTVSTGQSLAGNNSSASQPENNSTGNSSSQQNNSNNSNPAQSAGVNGSVNSSSATGSGNMNISGNNSSTGNTSSGENANTTVAGNNNPSSATGNNTDNKGAQSGNENNTAQTSTGNTNDNSSGNDSGSNNTNPSNTGRGNTRPTCLLLYGSENNGRWFAEAGFVYQTGFTSSDNTGSGISPVIGGGYIRPFGKRFSVSASAQYSFIGNASDSSRVFSSTNYGFGIEREKTEIGLRRLHYVQVPLMLNISAGEKNLFGAGISGAFLIASESRVRTYTETGSKIENEKTRSVFGYDNGLNKYDFIPMVSYSRVLNEKMAIMVRYQYGLTDIKDNSVFGIERFERNSGITFSLRYHF